MHPDRLFLLAATTFEIQMNRLSWDGFKSNSQKNAGNILSVATRFAHLRRKLDETCFGSSVGNICNVFESWRHSIAGRLDHDCLKRWILCVLAAKINQLDIDMRQNDPSRSGSAK